MLLLCGMGYLYAAARFLLTVGGVPNNYHIENMLDSEDEAQFNLGKLLNCLIANIMTYNTNINIICSYFQKNWLFMMYTVFTVNYYFHRLVQHLWMLLWIVPLHLNGENDLPWAARAQI